MGWEALRGQREAVLALRQTLRRGRVAGTHLFVGPESSGKKLAALLLGAALLCEEGGEDSCGRCPPCGRVARGTHPDVRVWGPPPGGVFKVERKEGEKEEGARELIAAVNRRPFEGRWKVYVLDDAHRVTLQAYNALLKTLEEPPGDTVLVLVTPNLHALPPTVVSRCRRVRFRALSREALEEILRERRPEAAPDHALLASLAGGRADRALSAEAGELRGLVAEALGWMEGLRGEGFPDDDALFALADGTAYRGEEGRARVQQHLGAVEELLRDALLHRLTPGEGVLHPDLTPRLAALAEGLGEGELLEALEAVGRARADLQRNANVQLVLETLLVELRERLFAREGVGPWLRPRLT
ncbi:MAG: ATP-binding protein [Nitrospinota bacterium]